MTRQTHSLAGVILALAFIAGCDSNLAKYRRANEVLAAEQAHLEGLRQELKTVVAKADEQREFATLSNKLLADESSAEDRHKTMQEPYSPEYLAAREAAKAEREKIFRMIAARKQTLDKIFEESRAAQSAVEAQERRVADAVALRNKFAPDTSAVGNDPIAVEARRLQDAAALYDRMALPLSGAEIVEAMRKRGFEVNERKGERYTVRTMLEGQAELFLRENLGKTRYVIVSIKTAHTDAAKRQKTMEMCYALAAVLLKLSDTEAEQVVGKAVSDAVNLGGVFQTKRIYGYATEATTMHAYGTAEDYGLHFFPTLLTR